MAERDSASLVDEMRDYIRKQVAAGYLSADEIEEAVDDVFLYDLDSSTMDPAMLRRIAGVETDKAFAARIDAQLKWPDITDCDRLDRAFAALDRSGIVARQNFTCCQTCGHAEIGDEIHAAEESGTKVIGYTFFHFQCTDGAVATGDLYLYYGSREGNEAASVRVGRTVVEAVEHHGLAAEWNGSLNSAILVKLSWQRRISQQMAERAPRRR
jgi:uncharacterized protein DUF6891